MNIFILDKDSSISAKMHFDTHVVKMILESAQILSTICRREGEDIGYKKTHLYHPCINISKSFIYFLNKYN